MLTTFIIALMMEAVSISKTSVNFYKTTRRNIPKDGHLHIRRRENLKSHICDLDGIQTHDPQLKTIHSFNGGPIENSEVFISRTILNSSTCTGDVWNML
jgi:hypothetical protein